MPRTPRRQTADEEHLLDIAVELTFPASDPIAIQHAFETAVRKRRRSEASETSAASGSQQKQTGKRSGRQRV